MLTVETRHAIDAETARGFDTDAHSASLDADHGDGDLVADEQTFANFAAEHQHIRTPLHEGPVRFLWL